MGFEVPEEAEDGTYSYPASLWIDSSDTLMEVLDSLLEEHVEVESS